MELGTRRALRTRYANSVDAIHGRKKANTRKKGTEDEEVKVLSDEKSQGECTEESNIIDANYTVKVKKDNTGRKVKGTKNKDDLEAESSMLPLRGGEGNKTGQEIEYVSSAVPTSSVESLLNSKDELTGASVPATLKPPTSKDNNKRSSRPLSPPVKKKRLRSSVSKNVNKEMSFGCQIDQEKGVDLVHVKTVEVNRLIESDNVNRHVSGSDSCSKDIVDQQLKSAPLKNNIDSSKSKHSTFSIVEIKTEPEKGKCTDSVVDIDWTKIFNSPGPVLTKGPRHIEPSLCYRSENVLHYLSNSALGRISAFNKKAVDSTYIHSPLEDYVVMDSDEPFKTRVTTIDWHPTRRNLITIGGKHGDIVFYKVEKDRGYHLEELRRIDGTGPGGYISALKYDPAQEGTFYTAALDGKVCVWSVETGAVQKILLNTMTWDNWFCSLDVHKSDNIVASGRSNGWVYLQSKQGELIFERRLHKGKVSHLEFSGRDPHLLCSSSLDHTVRLWDTRMISHGKPLEVLTFDKGINSAYFSLTDGSRLLATDQGDELRVYQGPLWQLERTIRHPHRFFQHLTPIKASWHPVKDLIVCGRFPDGGKYPEWGMSRVVDIMDGNTGKHVCEMKDSSFNKIVSLSKFSPTADMLLTSMGFSIQLWSKPAPYDEELCSEKERAEFSKYMENRSSSSDPFVGTWQNIGGYSTARGSGSKSKSDGLKSKRKRGGDDIDDLKKGKGKSSKGKKTAGTKTVEEMHDYAKKSGKDKNKKGKK